ncbi:glutaredoxin family protein [Microbacterium sp. B2969]|uniref:Glutaredoxin family protein n=1 Tax=Microbacterium alkaliflavum TaxID=3248839 RepID=A0ABW7Q9C4_9MICO
MITVYTTGSGCVQCRMTKQVMTSAGLEFADVDLTDPVNAVARDYVTDDLGYSQAPVVVVDENDHWSGFRPDLIDRLAQRLGQRHG